MNLRRTFEYTLLGAAALGMVSLAGHASIARADDVTDAQTQTQQSLQQHIQTLQTVLAQVPEQAKPAIERALEESQKALRNLRLASSEGSGDRRTSLENALAEVSTATQKHVEVLTKLLSTVPPSAQAAIQHAIRVSQHGSQVAQDHLALLQQGETRSGRPDISRPSDARPDVARPEVESHGVGRPADIAGGMPGGLPRGGRR